MKPNLTDDGHLKVTEFDGLVGFAATIGIMMPQFQQILHIIPVWAVAIICTITWRYPMNIRYRERKFSVKFGWDKK